MPRTTCARTWSEEPAPTRRAVHVASGTMPTGRRHHTLHKTTSRPPTTGVSRGCEDVFLSRWSERVSFASTEDARMCVCDAFAKQSLSSLSCQCCSAAAHAGMPAAGGTRGPRVTPSMRSKAQFSGGALTQTDGAPLRASQRLPPPQPMAPSKRARPRSDSFVGPLVLAWLLLYRNAGAGCQIRPVPQQLACDVGCPLPAYPLRATDCNRLHLPRALMCTIKTFNATSPAPKTRSTASIVREMCK